MKLKHRDWVLLPTSDSVAHCLGITVWKRWYTFCRIEIEYECAMKTDDAEPRCHICASLVVLQNV